MKTTNAISHTGGAASTVLVGPNPRRIALYLQPHGTNTYSLGIGQAAVLTTGFTCFAGTSYMYALTKEMIGDQIMGQISTISTGAFTIGVLEVLGP